MIPKFYALLQHAISEGVGYGVYKAFKHTDKPDAQTLIDSVEQAVMTSIHEWFDFEESNEG